jgi:hypothetical protein
VRSCGPSLNWRNFLSEGDQEYVFLKYEFHMHTS